MILTIFVAFLSLIALIILHELGHFVLAKKFGVRVEEFGIGYPPRLFGKKIKDTIYSLNLLPFGAFVRIYGQEERIESPDSFSTKPYWQKSLIILGGVASFWIVSFIILSIVMMIGVPTIVEDSENHFLVSPKVQIANIVPGSPAQEAGLAIGDTIVKVKDPTTGKEKNISKIKEVQDFVGFSRDKEIVLTIQRGKKFFEVSLVPKVLEGEKEAHIGVFLARTVIKRYPWYQAILKGILNTFTLTWLIIKSWAGVLVSLFGGKGLPPGVQVSGIVGIFDLFVKTGEMGVNYFLQFIAVIAVHLALINALPIPALDGGWFLFCTIEKIRRKPLNQKVIQKISLAFFSLMVILMIWITIKDIARILGK